MNKIQNINGVEYFISLHTFYEMPSICKMPDSREELELLLDYSSNWMKLFDIVPSLTITDLRKILFVEMCGRRRTDVINRIRATIDTRFRDYNASQIAEAYDETEEVIQAIREDEKCESE